MKDIECQYDTNNVYLAQFLEQIKKARGRNWISSSRLKGIENTAEKLLEEAEKACNMNNYREAFYMASAIAEAMVETMNSTTDDCGYESDILDRAIELLKIISQKNTKEAVRIKLFSYILNHCNSSPFDYAIDGEANAFEALIYLISDDEERTQVKNIIETYYSKYDLRQNNQLAEEYNRLMNLMKAV
ncbi:MAG: hypothetical protein LBT14_06905 [Treponema sp.]|jgi:hypothetical protein|nr:hypothetical protein [Treponema sp.]